jgi:hypothetical protein
MRAEFEARELKSVAGTFKAMQDLSRRIPLFAAAHFLEDGRVMFICDADYDGVHPMLHVKFTLKPSGEVSSLHERKSVCFLVSDFVAAVTKAKASDILTFEILSEGGAQVTVGGMRFYLAQQDDRFTSQLWMPEVSDGQIVLDPRRASDFKFLDELSVDQIKRAFEFVLPAVDPDHPGTRGCMLLEFHGYGCLRVAGTDSRRIHFADMGMCGKKMVPKDKSILIAPHAAKIITQAFSVLEREFPGPTPAKVQVSRGRMTYEDNERIEHACVRFSDSENRLALYIAFINDQWINYNSLDWILHASDYVSVLLDGEAIRKAREFFKSAAKTGKKFDIIPVDFHCLPDSSRIRLSLDYNGASASEEIDSLDMNKREFNICMNARMTADAFSLIRGSECVIFFKNDDEILVNPYLMMHRDEIGEYRSLIAPIDPERRGYRR